jgi:hypothetical protein
VSDGAFVSFQIQRFANGVWFIRIQVFDAEKVGADASSKLLAAAAPAYLVSKENDPGLDPNVVYPAALAKQLAKTLISFQATDIYIFLNHHKEDVMWSKVGCMPCVCKGCCVESVLTCLLL